MIHPVKGGFKVFSKAGRPLSKKPKRKRSAIKQLVAVEISKHKRGKSLARAISRAFMSSKGR